MKRLAIAAFVIGTLLAAILVTGAVEAAVLGYVVSSQVAAAEASGISMPNEGFTGSHMDLLIWALAVFIIVFPIAVAVLGLIAFRIWEKLFPEQDAEQVNGA